MELVYFWLERFGNKKNQDINFNQNYKFEVKLVNESYILSSKESSNKIPENYFGEKISNISCIIGNNGSGKTSLIKKILQLKDCKNFLSNEIKYILVFKKSKELKIKSNIEKNKIEVILSNTSYKYEKNRCNELYYEGKAIIPNGLKDDFNEIKYIYFTNDFKPMRESFITNVFDISLKNKLNHVLLNNKKSNIITGSDFITTLYNENLVDIAIFIIEHGDNFIEKIPYNDLKNKLLKIKREGILRYDVGELFSKNETYEIYQEIYNKINITNDDLKNKNFIEKFILNAWIFISDSIFYSINEKRLQRNYIDNFTQRKNEKMEKWFENQLEILVRKEDFSFLTNGDKIKLLYELIKSRCDNKLEISYRTDKVLIEKIKEINKFINLLKFYFKDGFSSGEYILIYLLKEFFDLKKNIYLNGPIEGIVFFLEEIESFLHPEWQRKSIEFLEIIAENCPWLEKKRIQFILSSHTPFLVGDLPRGNIKKIENFEIKDLTKNPFGDNLLNILKAQFQLESLFGEFTRKKILKYVKKLKEKEQLSLEEREEINFLLDNIEEPLIKNSLRKLYEQTLSTEEKIRFLEKELSKLKGESK